MPDDTQKIEKTEAPKAPDKIVQVENLTTPQQNAQYIQALESNPDQFHSMQDLRIPGAADVETFQLVDGSKTVASSRKVEEQTGGNSFQEGLKALPANATDQERVQYQIEYIERKAGKPGILLKTGIEVTEPKNDYDPIIKALDGYINEQKERAIGSTIGTVQGVGNVLMSVAWMADFEAALILGKSDRAREMGAEFGESVGITIVGGIKLFSGAYKYFYDVGFEGDYSKPFKDIATFAVVVNDRWQQLPPREQERRKAEMISQMLGEGLIGMSGAKTLGKAKQFTEFLDGVAGEALKNASHKSKRFIQSLSNNVKDLMSPEVEVAGVGKVKMRDLQQVTKDDLYNAMSDWSHAGGTTKESVSRKLTSYLLDPNHKDGGPKSDFFKAALGFTRENSDELAKQIVFDETKAVKTVMTEFGQKYRQDILIKGANGREIEVPFIWIKNPDGVVRLVTATKLGGK